MGGGKMKKHFPIIIEQDKDGVFIVECPVLKGCRSYGRNVDEALENIREAIEVCMMDEAPEFDKNMTFVGLRDLELALP
jgi:predicted RNase H-like HicB family nuclease